MKSIVFLVRSITLCESGGCIRIDEERIFSCRDQADFYMRSLISPIREGDDISQYRNEIIEIELSGEAFKKESFSIYGELLEEAVFDGVDLNFSYFKTPAWERVSLGEIALVYSNFDCGVSIFSKERHVVILGEDDDTFTIGYIQDGYFLHSHQSKGVIKAKVTSCNIEDMILKRAFGVFVNRDKLDPYFLEFVDGKINLLELVQGLGLSLA